MDQKPQTSALMALAVALGAGAASALLLIIAFKGTALAMTLAYLAPLPVMIAGFGFGSLAGLIAAVAGAGTVLVAGLVYGQQIGVAGSMLTPALTSAFGFAITIGLPGWWLTNRALAPAPPEGDNVVGRLLVWIAALVVLPVVLTLIVASTHFGGYEEAVSAVARRIEPVLRDSLEKSGAKLPPNFDAKDWADWVPRAMPGFAVASAVIMMAANLWLAGRVAVMSQQFPKEWPDIPFALVVPRVVMFVFAGATLVAFAGGLVGAIALIVALALGAVFSLVGLAVVHALARKSPARGPLLFGMYLFLAMLFPFPLILLAPLGLADTAMSLRASRAASSNTRN
jgi:hypothetical protein